jgi:hypothetical protein
MLGSCSFSLFNGYRHGNESGSITPVSWFRCDSDHLLMSTKIDLMKNHFSGLMVVKPLPDNGYRVVFITEVGLKIIDLEFIPGKPVKVHYAMDALNKKKVIGTLSRDIGLILMAGVTHEKPVVMHDRSSGEMVLKFKEKGRRYYYRINDRNGRAVNALLTSRILKKAKADFYSGNGIRIDSLKITHYNVNLHIQMFLINENANHAIE